MFELFFLNDTGSTFLIILVKYPLYATVAILNKDLKRDLRGCDSFYNFIFRGRPARSSLNSLSYKIFWKMQIFKRFSQVMGYFYFF